MTEITQDTKISIKLDLLWALLCGVAGAEGFPQDFIDKLQKQWEKTQ